MKISIQSSVRIKIIQGKKRNSSETNLLYTKKNEVKLTQANKLINLYMYLGDNRSK